MRPPHVLLTIASFRTTACPTIIGRSRLTEDPP